MSGLVLSWVLAGLLSGSAAALAADPLPVEIDLAALGDELHGAGDRLLAAEHCPQEWEEMEDAVGGLSERLEAVPEKERDRLGPEITAARRTLANAIATCERRLRERCYEIARQLRRHARHLRASADGAPESLRERVAQMEARITAVVAGVTPGTATDGEFLQRLEAEWREIGYALEALDPCEKRLRPALSRLGSVAVERSFEELCEVTAMRCLYAPHAATARQALAGLVPGPEALAAAVDLHGERRVAADLRALFGLPRERLERCLPGAAARLEASLERLGAADRRIPDTAPPAAVVTAPSESDPPPVTRVGKVDDSPSPSEVPALPAASGFLALDVWQSAWSDFAEFDAIVPYLRRNRITEVNLNPGFAMSHAYAPEAYRRLQPLVATLRRAGVERINFLYAELNYPVARYAAFLKRHPDLGIGTLIDDSEFTDHFVGRFRRNCAAVRAKGLRYSAFVTLEGVGNSGVSDETRFWALETLDEPILMSYFSCTVDEQLALLAPYLAYADRRSRVRPNVKVALLMGGKSVGREVSCELRLDADAFPRFVAELDRRLRRYRSYAGIVLETNRRLPRYDVAAPATQ